MHFFIKRPNTFPLLPLLPIHSFYYFGQLALPIQLDFHSFPALSRQNKLPSGKPLICCLLISLVLGWRFG